MKSVPKITILCPKIDDEKWSRILNSHFSLMRDLKKIKYLSGRVELNDVVSNSETISVDVKRPKNMSFQSGFSTSRITYFLSRISKEDNKTEK